MDRRGVQTQDRVEGGWWMVDGGWWMERWRYIQRSTVEVHTRASTPRDILDRTDVVSRALAINMCVMSIINRR